MNPMEDARTRIVAQSYRHFVARDREAHEALLAADFRFTSPYDNGIDKQAFYSLCWPNGEGFERITLIETFAQDEQVFVIYDATFKDGRAARNAELHVVRDGLIRSVEVYFGWSLPHPASKGEHVDP